MPIKLVTLKCPECGALLSIEENRSNAFCTYCGAKILINNPTVTIKGDESFETDQIFSADVPVTIVYNKKK